MCNGREAWNLRRDDTISSVLYKRKRREDKQLYIFALQCARRQLIDSSDSGSVITLTSDIPRKRVFERGILRLGMLHPSTTET